MRVRPGKAPRAVLGLLAALFWAGCTAGGLKGQYVLAERLWNDGKYAAAASEFEKIAARDPRGKLGLQSLYRAATTQELFLNEHEDALRNFRRFIEQSADSHATWDARKRVGEILFARLERYDHAIPHYQAMLRERPDAPEAPELRFRLAKSFFFLHHFDEAIHAFEQLAQRHPRTPWGEKAAFEIGVSYFTRGEQAAEPEEDAKPKKKRSGAYQLAIDAYRKFIADYPGSSLIPQARFGIASCLEELDQLDAAFQAFQALAKDHPSPNVIRIKLARIRERKAQRNR